MCLHEGFPDPSATTGSAEQRLNAFRRVRDGIGERIGEFLTTQQSSSPNEQPAPPASVRRSVIFDVVQRYLEVHRCSVAFL